MPNLLLEDFLHNNPNEGILITQEKDVLGVRPISNFGGSMLLNPAGSQRLDLDEAVRNFDERNGGYNLSKIIDSSPEAKKLLEYVLVNGVMIGNEGFQCSAIFDVYQESPFLLRYQIGVIPQFVDDVLESKREGIPSLKEFRGVLHTGIGHESLAQAYSRLPENYSDRFGF